MGSDAEVQAPAPEPVTEPIPASAASGGSKTGMILAIVVVAVVVIAALAYVFVIDDGGDELSGQWTVSGGNVVMKMVANNDTANATWQNVTIPADTEVIDFDDPETIPDEMKYTDNGDGTLVLEDFSMGEMNFDSLDGTYDIDGDTMTITFSGVGSYVDSFSGDYIEVDFSETVNFASA